MKIGQGLFPCGVRRHCVASPEARRACELLESFAKLHTPIAFAPSLPTSLCLLPSPLFRGEGQRR